MIPKIFHKRLVSGYANKEQNVRKYLRGVVWKY